MQEKEMVSDVLSSLKSSLSNYGRVIGECEDQELRQTIQQIRNQCEHYHYQMFKVAEQKNYYKPAQKQATIRFSSLSRRLPRVIPETRATPAVYSETCRHANSPLTKAGFYLWNLYNTLRGYL